MKSVLLLGAGRFGLNVARKLYDLDHEVMAVDSNEEYIQDILPYVTTAKVGDVEDYEFLKSLDVPSYDVVIVAIGSKFEASLIATTYLKELGAKKLISRASSDIHEKLLKRNGADYVVFPEKQLGTWTAINYTSDAIIDYFTIDNEYGVYEIQVPKAIVGKTVGNSNIRQKYSINIMAIKTGNEMSLEITADTVFEEGQTLLVIGTLPNVRKFFKD